MIIFIEGDLITLADDHDLLLALKTEQSPISIFVLPEGCELPQIKKYFFVVNLIFLFLEKLNKSRINFIFIEFLFFEWRFYDYKYYKY